MRALAEPLFPLYLPYTLSPFIIARFAFLLGGLGGCGGDDDRYGPRRRRYSKQKTDQAAMLLTLW